MPRSTSVEALKQEIYARERFKGRISLDPITACMDAFGNPQQDYPVIQIAGTNGKGSTATILTHILQKAGYTTGLYTSPHLTTLRERVRVNDNMVEWGDVRRVHEKAEEAGIDLSFFEFTTALAYDHFSSEDVDVAVVETGMGGRLDATSVAVPAVSVITNVSRDHTAVLGETPEQIAHEKAGIIADGAPVVSGAEGPPQRVIADVADEHDAPCHPVNEHVSVVGRTGDGLVIAHGGDRLQTRLHGTYQVDNTNTALSALAVSPVDAADDKVRAALRDVTVPGRMEVVEESPRLVLDGAHNPAGMRRAAESYREVAAGETVAVVSIMADKQHKPMLSVLEQVVDRVVCTRAGIDRAADPDDLAAAVGVPCTVMDDVSDAVSEARQQAGPGGTVLCTGSLYFIGDVKQAITSARR